MNYNMTFRNRITHKGRLLCGMSLLLMAFFLLVSMKPAIAKASQTEEKGDILLIHSASLDTQELGTVNTLVEILTYQGFQVRSVPANIDGSEMLNYSYVICYHLGHYSEEFLASLHQYEASGTKDQYGTWSTNLLFLGNQCLKDYLDATGRTNLYQEEINSMGQVAYSFDSITELKRIAKEDSYLFLKDTSGYRSGNITVDSYEGYFCAGTANLTHIPVTDYSEPLIKAALIRELSLWKWPYLDNPPVYAQYIVIDQVYPYQDPEKLQEIVQMFIDKGNPFVISVMPIYVNGTYPAMQRFCEILRYAQANGGAIILHAPINQMPVFDLDTMQKYLTQVLEIYIKQGVYPIALEVPHNWIFNEDCIEAMRHFKTIFTSPETDPYLPQAEVTENTVYKDGHQWVSTAVALDDYGASYISATSTAVYISMNQELSAIEAVIHACEKSFIPMKSLWDMEHSVWTDKDTLSYQAKGMFVNQEKVDLTFVPTVYEDNFQYKRNILQRFSKDLTSESKKLLLVVGITSILFVIFILWARYVNRKNYFIHKDDID